MRRAIVLVDGEHYPPVIIAALDDLRARGIHPVGAVFLGGTEKVARYGAAVDLGIPSTWVGRDATQPGSVGVAAAAQTLEPLLAGVDVVIDMSDEPVLDARRRMQLAAHVLAAGVPYEGADFSFTPPPRPRLTQRPTIAVIGTGKRTGKTAISGELVRRAMAQGEQPVVVAMGRGGPPQPVVVPAGGNLDIEALLRIADAGGHAASDVYEDAVTTGATAVGARRCGGGLAGATMSTTVPEAIATAEQLPGTLTVLEGSGAAIPPAAADVTVCVVPADCDAELLGGYLGAYRLLLADVVVATMCEPPRGSPARVDTLREAIRSISRRAPVLRTVFRPVPLGPVSGQRVFFATTAPAGVSASLVESLQARYGCEVVATSNRLADRPALSEEIQRAPAFDVLLVELKAAAVDVAARSAARAGARVVFCDNRPTVTGVDLPQSGGGGAILEGTDPDDGSDAVLDNTVAQLVRTAAQRAAQI